MREARDSTSSWSERVRPTALGVVFISSLEWGLRTTIFWQTSGFVSCFRGASCYFDVVSSGHLSVHMSVVRKYADDSACCVVVRSRVYV